MTNYLLWSIHINKAYYIPLDEKMDRIIHFIDSIEQNKITVDPFSVQMYIFKYSSELPLPSLDSINFLYRHGKSVNIVYIINNTSDDEKYINLYKQYLILL